MKTEVISKTLCPIWDQTLIFNSVEIHQSLTDILTNPPYITIELLDKDDYVENIFFYNFMGKVKV